MSQRPEQFRKERGARIPWGRIGEVSEVANTAAFLASSESDYLTGLTITVGGGSEMS